MKQTQQINRTLLNSVNNINDSFNVGRGERGKGESNEKKKRHQITAIILYFVTVNS